MPCSIVLMFDYLQIACDSLSIQNNEMGKKYTFIFDASLTLTFLPPSQVETVAFCRKWM